MTSSCFLTRMITSYFCCFASWAVYTCTWANSSSFGGTPVFGSVLQSIQYQWIVGRSLLLVPRLHPEKLRAKLKILGFNDAGDQDGAV